MGNCHSVHEENARRPGNDLGRNFDRGCQNESPISACDDEVEDFDFVQPTKKKPGRDVTPLPGPLTALQSPTSMPSATSPPQLHLRSEPSATVCISGFLKRLRNRFRKRESSVQTPVAPPCFTPVEDLGSPGDLTPSTDAECVTSQQPTRHAHTGTVDLNCDTILSKHDDITHASYRNDRYTTYGNVSLVPYDDTPVPSEDVTPVPSEDVTPVPSEDVTPVQSEDVTPVPSEDVTPVPSEDVTPVPSEDVTPVQSEDVTPVPHDDVTPVPSEDVTHVPSEDVTPVQSEDVTPVPSEDVTPVPHDDGPLVPYDVTHVASEDVTPVPSEDVTPVPSEDVTPVQSEDVTPVPHDDVTPEPYHDVTPESYYDDVTPVSHDDATPALSEDDSHVYEDVAYGQNAPISNMDDARVPCQSEVGCSYRKGGTDASETDLRPSLKNDPVEIREPRNIISDHLKKDPPGTTRPHREEELNGREAPKGPSKPTKGNVFTDLVGKFCRWKKTDPPDRVVTPRSTLDQRPKILTNILGNGASFRGEQYVGDRRRQDVLFGPELGGQRSSSPKAIARALYGHSPFPQDDGLSSYRKGVTGYRGFQNGAAGRGQFLEDRGRRAQANGAHLERIDDWSRRFQNVGLGRDQHDVIDKGRDHFRESGCKGLNQEDVSGRTNCEPRDVLDGRYDKVSDRGGHANQLNGCKRTSPRSFDDRDHKRQQDSGYDPRYQPFDDKGGYVQQEGTDCRRLDGGGRSKDIDNKNGRLGFDKGSGYRNPVDDRFDRYEPFDDGGGHRKQVRERMQGYHEPFYDKDGRFKPPDDSGGPFKAKYGLGCGARQTDDGRSRDDWSSRYRKMYYDRNLDYGFPSSNYKQTDDGRDHDGKNSRYRQTDSGCSRDDGNSRYRQTDSDGGCDDGRTGGSGRNGQTNTGCGRNGNTNTGGGINGQTNTRGGRNEHPNTGDGFQGQNNYLGNRRTQTDYDPDAFDNVGRRRNDSDGVGGRRQTVERRGQNDESRQTYGGGGYRRQTVRDDGQGVNKSRHTYVDADGRCNQQGNDGDNHTAVGNTDSQQNDKYLTDKNVSARISNSINDSYENSQSAMQYPPVETKKYGSLEHMKLIKLQNQTKSRRLKQVQTKVAQTWQTPRRNYSYSLSNENKEVDDGHSYDASGGNNQHDVFSGQHQNDAGGGYPQNYTGSGYQQHDAFGGYHQNDASGGLHPNDAGGGYHRNDTGGSYRQQIKNGNRYIEREADIGDRHERSDEDDDDTECLQNDENWAEQRNKLKDFNNRIHHDESFQYESDQAAMQYPPVETKKYGSLEHMKMIKLQNQAKNKRLKQVQTKVAQTWQTPRKNYSYSLGNDYQISQNPDNNNYGTVSHNKSIQQNNSKMKRNIDNAHSKINTWNTNAAKLASAAMRRPQGPPLSKGSPQGPFRRPELNNKSSPWSRNTGNSAAQTKSAKGNQTTVKKRMPIQAMTSSGLIYNTYTYV